ncbi:hypothetical protein [Caballeronia catudaia]|nr:hypothetical protein [Caballeronia catudaia]
MQQLDIFADSRDVGLRNDVVEHLQRRHAVDARASLTELASEYPDDSALPAMTALVRELENESSRPLTDHAELTSVFRHLEEDVMPAAQRVLPAKDIQAWSTACWRSLAQRAAPLGFCATHSESHAAPLWLRAGNWAAATDAVNTIESWWRIPSPLAWMTQARYQAGGLDAAWPLFAELAWLAPSRFAALIAGLRDASLDALRRRFDADFSGTGEIEDYMWFPAWLVVVKPALASRLGEARVQRDLPASRATALLGEVLRREHEGDQYELVTLREELSRLHTGLFDAYMATRKVQHR